jgi:hypothetical protein
VAACALPEFRRQCLRPVGVTCRERDVAGGVPEPAYRRADKAGSENRDLHRSSRHDQISELFQ